MMKIGSFFQQPIYCRRSRIAVIWVQATILTALIVNAVNAQTIEQRIHALVAQMSLEEKIKQLHQEGSFNTADNQRLGIPGFFMADGPHGVRDGLATAFPVGIAMAATWDPILIEKIGVAMGKEFAAKGRHQALGPCIDLCRDPRNGRSAESSGEDPYLSAQIVSALVKGIQTQPIVATVKHYNGVNRQNNRHNSNVLITQRGLMEHYGLNFRTAVQRGSALSVMNAYNLINGQKSAENHNLLTTILRQKWGFPYYVVSDWGSIWNSEAAIKAGCNICMGSDKYENDLPRLVQSGTVSEATIDEAVRNVLRTKMMIGLLDHYPRPNPADLNSNAHQTLALETARKSIILLKNEGDLLPLDASTLNTVAVIGPSADVAQLDGTGSSYVTPFYTISPRFGIENKIGATRVRYAKGCDINSADVSGFAEAKLLAAQSDAVIFVGGLDASQEGEGLDRVGGSIQLPGQQQSLINQLAAVNRSLIVVLKSGGICGLANSIGQIPALIYAFYPGQEGGNAIADVLFGDVNPGGKLPVTMPINDAQLPDRNSDFTDDAGCGYRWFDQQNLTPQFAFGFGLSYTKFEYSNLMVSPSQTTIGQQVEVRVDVENVGKRDGEEVVQLYLTDDAASVAMPLKQLKAFQRVALSAGEKKTITLCLAADEFYYFNEVADRYEIEPGRFTVRVGSSSDQLPLSDQFELTSADPKPDLQIVNITMVPPFPVQDDEVVFLATVINQGTGPSPAGQSHQVTFFVDGTEVSQSIDFDSAIPVGGMALVGANIGFDGKSSWSASQVGTFSLKAEVDADSRIDECIESNNAKSIDFEVSPAPAINAALHRRVIATSVEGSGLEAQNAVDGNYSTRWASAYSDIQFILVDLDSVRSIDRVLLFWETAYGKEYEIQVSNDLQRWTTIEHITDSDGGLDEIVVNASGRYVRMDGIKRATQWGYSLYEFEIYLAGPGTGLGQKFVAEQEPSDYSLSANYPNPFNPATVIDYALPEKNAVMLQIFDLTGKLVRTLVNAEQSAGRYRVEWDGQNANGQPQASGVYFYKMTAGAYAETRKMLLVR